MKRLLRKLEGKQFDRWLGGYARHMARAAVQRPPRGTRHLLFAVCDHYEPLWGKPTDSVGLARVNTWRERYPKLARRFTDADGRHPLHSFFFPGEEYRPEFFDSLEELLSTRAGEIELHLHHDQATEASFRQELADYLGCFAGRGHFSRDGKGTARYAFIHGNWCLANARPDGKWCGVDNELEILFETGCYADFTFPAIPDVSQPNIVNQIYWPTGDLSRRRAYETGLEATVGTQFSDRLLMIEGPCAVGLRDGLRGIRLEYAALMSSDPPTESRVHRWVRQNIHVQGRPEWVFVKTHTHGAPEREAEMLLGPGGDALHTALQRHYNDGQRWQLHYVTAREMYNIAKAAMAGHRGNPNDYRDYELPPPPFAARL